MPIFLQLPNVTIWVLYECSLKIKQFIESFPSKLKGALHETFLTIKREIKNKLLNFRSSHLTRDSFFLFDPRSTTFKTIFKMLV